MRVVLNRSLVKRRGRLGRALTLGGFATLAGGLLYSCTAVGSQDSSTILVSYAFLIGGFLMITMGKRPWLQFSIRPRPDEVLANNLKTLDVRNVLFSYVSALPVEHLLMSNSGLTVIEVRPIVGDVVVRGERWSRRRGILGWLQLMSEGPLGNPTRDALEAVEKVQNLLVERLGSEAADKVPVRPIVIFTHPRAVLTIEDPTIPVCHARNARDEVRKISSGPRVAGDVQRKLELLLLEEARPEGEPISANAAVDRRPRRKITRAR